MRVPTSEERAQVEKFAREQFNDNAPVSDEEVIGWIEYWGTLARSLGVDPQDEAFRKRYSA